MPILSHRIFSIDLLRTLAIIFVVLLHIIGVNWQNPQLSGGVQFIFRLLTVSSYMGVPLFIIISGALLLPQTHSIKHFFHTRLTRVVPPWIFYGGLMLLSQVYLQLISHQPLTLPKPHHIYFGTYWFVPLILGLYLVTPLLQWLQSNQSHIYLFLFLLWFGLFSLLPTITALYFTPSFLAVSPGLTLQLFGYYLAGFLLQTSRHLPPLLLTITLCLLLLFHAAILEVFHLHHSPSYYAAYINPLTVLASLILVKLITQNPRNSLPRHSSLHQLITILATTSYGIYLVHPILQNLLRYSLFDPTLIPITLSPTIKPFIFTLILLLLSASFVRLLQKLPLTRQFAG